MGPVGCSPAAQTPRRVLIVNLWLLKGRLRSGGGRPSPPGRLEQETVSPDQQHNEHHDVERYVVFA